MKRNFGMMAVALALLPFGLPSAARAQSGEVVQSVPSAAAVERLNSNLARLSRTPQDVDALLGAGQAALDLGDVQAANGFFTRANLVNPRLGAAKLGLAVVELALKQPQDAATNFDAADALGEHAEGRLADRGLAYDLTGQQAKAQRDYLAAMRANPNDSKARMRYAVSLGISGRFAEADQQMDSLLKAGDREAWRFRAFIYAMNGKQAEARNITTSVMPKGLADALEPYMVRVPLLTAAQKAAAAHYGDFPANVLRLNPPAPQVAVAAAPPPREIAEAEPAKRDNSRKARNKREAEQSKPVQIVIATPAPQPVLARPDLTPPPPPPFPAQTQAPTTRPLLEPVQPVRAQPDTNPGRPVPLDARSRAAAMTPGPANALPRPTPTPTPSQTLASAPTPKPIFTVPPPPAPTPTPTPTISPLPASDSLASKALPTRTLASALSSLSVPAGETKKDVAAVDLGAVAKLQADKAKKAADAKAKAEKDAKAKAEAELKKKLKDNPSRIWVQIAAGKNKSALAFDMRRFRKSYADAIGDEAGWFFPWGGTNRLLIGPYRKEERARDIIAAIKKAGGDAFLWESEAGDEVTKIGGQ